MLLSLDSAISALSQFQEALNVSANNIANVNTIGFKGATVNFQDTFSQTVGASGPGGSMQVGTGPASGGAGEGVEQAASTNSNGKSPRQDPQGGTGSGFT